MRDEVDARTGMAFLHLFEKAAELARIGAEIAVRIGLDVRFV
jgi:hypothetical protein